MNVYRLGVALGISLGMVAGPALAADELFSPEVNRGRVTKPGELLRQVMADPANARIEFVSARADLIHAAQQQVQFSLPGGIAVDAQRSSFEQMESGNQVWVGRIDDALLAAAGPSGTEAIDAAMDNVILVRSGDTLLGTIRIAGELYRLVPVDRGGHVLVWVDPSKFQVDEDADAYKQMLKGPTEPVAAADASSKAISTIRVMVAFGAAATAAVGNEQQAMDLAFTESNQALAATNTDIRFQQAGAIRFYTQSETTNYATMLSRLTNGSDGYYDAIAGQRNTNTADLVAYIAPASSTLCGQAAGIATPNASAYFVMSPSCLSGNFTFVHEAGHVVGTRHDNDPTTSPFTYGHGYVISSVSRRTAMAVNNGPCPSCTRLGAFSTPDYTFSGVPIGTATSNNNTRVWRTRGPTAAAFR